MPVLNMAAAPEAAQSDYGLQAPGAGLAAPAGVGGGGVLAGTGGWAPAPRPPPGLSGCISRSRAEDHAGNRGSRAW